MGTPTRALTAACLLGLVVGACSSPPVALTPLATAPVAGTSGGAASQVPASPPPPSVLATALSGVHPDGTFSMDTALAAFVASFGPLPGVTASTSTGEVESGTLAIDMVASYWTSLSDAQRAAVEAWIGNDAGAVVQAAYQPPPSGAVDQAAVNAALAEIAAHLGHPLSIPVVVVPPDPAVMAKHPSALAWTAVIYDVPGTAAQRCLVTVTPAASASAATLRFTLLHELWHCFQGALVGRAARLASPMWLKEGEAQWVAESITNGAGAPADVAQWWSLYLANPKIPLLARTYDAVGFFAQLEYSGNDPWKLLESMYAAADSYAALDIANYSDPSFLDSLGSSFYRDGQPSKAWAMTANDGILSAEDVFAVPDGVQLKDDGDATVDAPALGAAIADLHSSAFVTEIESSGSVRVGDKAGGGIDDALDNATLDLCTASGGDCTCPPGTVVTKPIPKKAPQDLRVAASGDQKVGGHAFLQGISRDKWCTQALNLFVDGTDGGKPIKGQIIGYPTPDLTCYAYSIGSAKAGNLVHWDGYTSVTNTSIAGEFDVQYGTWTLGTAQGDQTVTMDELVPVYDHIPSISGTITQTATSGSIDALFSGDGDTMHVSGTWTCPSGSPPP